MRRFVIVTTVILGLAGAWAAAWQWLAGNMRVRVDQWAAERRAEGLTVAYEGVAVTGFPLHWRVLIDRPQMAGAGPSAWNWQGEAVEADLLPWSLRDVPLRFPGDQRFSAGGGNVAETWIARAARPNGRAFIDDRGRLDRFEFDFGDATLSRAGDAQPTQAERLTGSAVLHRGTAGDYRADTFDLHLVLDNATLALAPVRLLGAKVAHAELDLAFKGRLSGGRLAEAAAAWRDSGGTVEVNRFAMKWGPVDADGNGTLALDAENRLLGAFTARWRGYNETIDALQALGEIRPMQAAGVKIGLSAMARQNGSGAGEIQIPLAAQDGRLFVAGFPLMALPPLKFD
jgi:hypothetical protein